MNLKKIENEITKLFMVKFGTNMKYHKDLADGIYKLINQAIKQIVESVPVKEKPNQVIHKEMDDLTKEWFKAQMTESEREDCGYNQHVKEIKQWKKQVLKQLKEGK